MKHTFIYIAIKNRVQSISADLQLSQKRTGVKIKSKQTARDTLTSPKSETKINFKAISSNFPMPKTDCKWARWNDLLSRIDFPASSNALLRPLNKFLFNRWNRRDPIVKLVRCFRTHRRNYQGQGGGRMIKGSRWFAEETKWSTGRWTSCELGSVILISCHPASFVRPKGYLRSLPLSLFLELP